MEEIQWTGQHLKREAHIWWRTVRDRIKNFDDFTELFTEKYWNIGRQEVVSGNLEYGRYNYKENLNTVQY